MLLKIFVSILREVCLAVIRLLTGLFPCIHHSPPSNSPPPNRLRPFSYIKIVSHNLGFLRDLSIQAPFQLPSFIPVPACSKMVPKLSIEGYRALLEQSRNFWDSNTFTRVLVGIGALLSHLFSLARQ